MWIIRDSIFIGILEASPLILAAMGFTLIYYLNGFINFAFGETITYGAYLAAMFNVAFGVGFYVSIVPVDWFVLYVALRTGSFRWCRKRLPQ